MYCEFSKISKIYEHSMRRGKNKKLMLVYIVDYFWRFGMEILHQCIHFSFVFYICVIRLSMVSISFFQSSIVIEEKVFVILGHSSIIPFSGVSYQFNFLFKITHWFLIEFKSSDWKGLEKTLKGCLRNHRSSRESFLKLLKARKHLIFFPCYKSYKNSRFFLDEKAQYQPWIIKKKQKFGWISQN
jgi:hypothetical protein